MLVIMMQGLLLVKLSLRIPEHAKEILPKYIRHNLPLLHSLE
jgi:hypothetical protein